MTKNFKKYKKDIINGCVYVEKLFIILKIIYGIQYRGSKLCLHVVLNLTME
jgi:hypothetical protein